MIRNIKLKRPLLSKYYVRVVFIGLLLIGISSAQSTVLTCPNNGDSYCRACVGCTGSCPSPGDVILYDAYFTEATSCDPCTPGEVISPTVNFIVRNGASAPRYCIRLFYVLQINNYYYYDLAIALGNMIEGKTNPNYYEKTFTASIAPSGVQIHCGDTVKIHYATLAWVQNSQSCPSTYSVTDCTPQETFIGLMEIKPALSASFTYAVDCDQYDGQNVHFTANALGGNPPYNFYFNYTGPGGVWSGPISYTTLPLTVDRFYPLGTYFARLKVTDTAEGQYPGCKFITGPQTIIVYPKPEATIRATSPQ